MSEEKLSRLDATDPVTGRIDEAVQQIEELDTTEVRAALCAPDGRFNWLHYRANEVGAEWRRWRLRRILGFDEAPAVSIAQYEKLAVSLGLPPGEVGRPADGVPPQLSYDDMFPQGSVVPRAQRDRVLHSSREGMGRPQYDSLLAECARRRTDYLTKHGDNPRQWVIPDLASAAAIRACRRDVAGMQPPPDSAYSGGRVHGWDIHYDVLNSRSHSMYLGEGPAIIGIHEDPHLVAAISEQVGRTVYPTRCTYLPYRKGDFLGVHTDQPNCEVSVMFLIDGEPGPLRAYFEVAARDPLALDRWVQDNGSLPDGGEDYVYQQREGYALTGRIVPHARPLQSDYALVGALFYTGLI
jgi:hypothetical protein